MYIDHKVSETHLLRSFNCCKLNMTKSFKITLRICSKTNINNFSTILEEIFPAQIPNIKLVVK